MLAGQLISWAWLVLQAPMVKHFHGREQQGAECTNYRLSPFSKLMMPSSRI